MSDGFERWLKEESLPVRDTDRPLPGFEGENDMEFGIVDLTDRESTLAEKAEWVYQTNVNNGWYEEDRSFGEDIALLHSEVSEALEAYRDYGTEDVTDWPPTPQSLAFEVGDPDKARMLFIESQIADGKMQKPQGVGSEFADVLVRLLDTCKRHDVDLEFEFNRKMRFNETRGHRHGGKRL